MTYVTFKPGWKAAPAAASRQNEYHPPVDIVETGDAYTIEFDLPGFTREDIKVSVDDGVLKVSGERTRNVEKDERYYRYFERPEGAFSRSFRLPDHVDGEGIKATHTNGVLRLELPKKEDAKPHTVEIK
jgi:HSP20 family protein